MTKAKAYYQAKLILDNLSIEEYNKIPKDIIDYIENNMEVDESITINPNLSLESQKISEETYDILDKVIKKIDFTVQKEQDNIINLKTAIPQNDLNMKIKLENVKLTNMLNVAKKENSKIPKIKELVEEYKNALKSKDEEIEDLKAKNEELYASIEKTPRFIRKIFFKNFEKRLLK